MDDQQIVELYWQRSEEALRQSEMKYGAYCRSIAGGILESPQDTEECLSDTWLGAWNAMPPHRPNRLRLFLGKITRRLACDAVRAQSAQKRGGGTYIAALEELTDCIPSVPGADQAVEDRELVRMVNRFLHALRPRDCNIFLRRYWYTESLDTIAGRYGLCINTVKTSLFRSRKKLRAYLEKEGVML